MIISEKPDGAAAIATCAHPTTVRLIRRRDRQLGDPHAKPSLLCRLIRVHTTEAAPAEPVL